MYSKSLSILKILVNEKLDITFLSKHLSNFPATKYFQIKSLLIIILFINSFIPFANYLKKNIQFLGMFKLFLKIKTLDKIKKIEKT